MPGTLPDDELRMTLLETLALALYYAALIVLVAFGAHRLWLTWLLARRGPEPPRDVDDARDAEGRLPRVTVQLPMYNERHVAERVIRAAAALDYPRDRLEVQVVDDSTDDTRERVDRVARELCARGLDVRVVRRDDRVGYKAGALAHATESATGDLLCVFDADFVPPSGFLRALVGHFADPNVGMVQARWDHLNPESRLLTRAQAVLLDGHFLVEQPARARGGRIFHFNGTAGIWRRQAIEDAGGWAHDTITEDLDLSVRAQLAGWSAVYRADVGAPAELPADMSAFRSQQHRWAKGSIECLRKLASPLLRSGEPWWRKLEAFVPLTANLSYLALALVALLMPVVTDIRRDAALDLTLLLDLPLFTIGTLSVGAFYLRSQADRGTPVWQRLLLLPLAIAVDIGVALHKARAVLEALVGHKSAFVRTPKFALVKRTRTRRMDGYLRRTIAQGVPELAMAAWLLFGAFRTLSGPNPSWLPLPFFFLFALGFGYVGAVGVGQRMRLPARSQAVAAAEA